MYGELLLLASAQELFVRLAYIDSPRKLTISIVASAGAVILQSLLKG